MHSNFNKLALALAATAIATLVACGGGGGGSSSPATATMTVTPSLGQFSNGTQVVITDPNGNPIGASGTPGTASAPALISSGSATVTVGSYSGPVVVKVLGGSGVTYFDESKQAQVPFPSSSALVALMPAPTASMGVTALTNAAYAKIGNPASASSSAIANANASVAAAFGLPDILIAPTLINAASAPKLNSAAASDQYALVLAALANTASSSQTPALSVTTALASGMAASTPVVNNSVVAAFTAAASAAALTYADATTQIVIGARPLSVVASIPVVTEQPNQSNVNLAKALFSNLRTTFLSFSNVNGTGFLNTMPVSVSSDLSTNVTPNMQRVEDRFNAMVEAVNFLQSIANPASVPTLLPVPSSVASAASATAVVASAPNITFPSGTVFTTTSGSLTNVFNGTGNYLACYANSGSVNSVASATCVGANPSSVEFTTGTSGKLKAVVITMLQPASGSAYTYSAARYNVPFTIIGGTSLSLATLTRAYNNYYTLNTNAPVYLPMGFGTFSQTSTNGNTTAINYSGTMPPSTSTCITANSTAVDKGDAACPASMVLVPETDVDTYTIVGAKTGTVAASHYAVQGSIVTKAVDYSQSTYTVSSTQAVSFAINSGSYFDQNETNSASTGPVPLDVNLSLTAMTLATQFNGSMVIPAFETDVNGNNRIPSSVTFNGSYVNTAGSSPSTVLTGKLVASTSNYSSIDSNAANPTILGTVQFTGTLQAPSSPLITLVIGATSTGNKTGTVTGSFSYGSGSNAVSITATGAVTANSNSNTVTLTDQNGLQYAADANIQGQIDVTKSGMTLATVRNGVINYADGTSESAQ